MKIGIAPDSFKGSMKAFEAARGPQMLTNCAEQVARTLAIGRRLVD